MKTKIIARKGRSRKLVPERRNGVEKMRVRHHLPHPGASITSS
jgi:hypothetical protein